VVVNECIQGNFANDLVMKLGELTITYWHHAVLVCVHNIMFWTGITEGSQSPFISFYILFTHKERMKIMTI